MILCVVVCCSVLGRDQHNKLPSVYFCVLQHVAVLCSVLLCVAGCWAVVTATSCRVRVCCSVLKCVAVCCDVLQCVTVCWGVVTATSCRVNECCSVFLCIAVCCSVSQCVTVCHSVSQCVVAW